MNISMSSKPKHPGTITFVDDSSRETVEKAADVPESIRFAPDKEGKPTPVVRVVSVLHGDQRTIREYAADGTLLRSTVQRKAK
jgi:hypothetical protein